MASTGVKAKQEQKQRQSGSNSMTIVFISAHNHFVFSATCWQQQWIQWQQQQVASVPHQGEHCMQAHKATAAGVLLRACIIQAQLLAGCVKPTQHCMDLLSTDVTSSIHVL